MKVLAYTSPARGHLNPMMGPLLELRRRGAEVHVRTLASQVEAVRAAGLECEAIDPAIEAVPHGDYDARNQIEAGLRSFQTFAKRAPLDAADFEAAVDATGPDLALVDVTTFGAKAVAEKLDLRWAESRPFLLEDPAPGVPPFGLGLRPMGGIVGRIRDGAVGMLGRSFDRKARLPALNAGRRAAGLPPLAAGDERHRAPLTLYFTAEPFEYPRPLPPGVGMFGAGEWDTAADSDAAVELPADDRPLALVACSSEFQDDGAIAAAALAGLGDRWRLVVTTAGVDPAELPADRGDAVVARFLPHGPLLREADVVVCHGGMGITQKALAHGVPVCVVPWGRDQLEVAAHLVAAEAGARVSRRRLSPARLAGAVERTRHCRPGAERVRAGFEATGGAAAAATALEEMVAAPTP